MSGPGLVKKLLFPAYADAGANVTFSGKENVDDDNETAVLSSTDDLRSEATTVIHDNRTGFNQSLCSERDRYIDKLDVQNSRSELGESSHLESKLGTPASANGFFPSTAPPLSRPQTTRGMSTTTLTGYVEKPLQSHSPKRREIGYGEGKAGVSSRRLDEQSIREHAAAEFNFDSSEKISSSEMNSDFTRRGKGASCNSTDGVDDWKSDIGSDVLSTASEMGTVINISSRMAEVNAMALLTPIAIAEEDSETDDDGDHGTTAGLSIPTLDDRPNSLADDIIDADVDDQSIGNQNPQISTSSAKSMVSAAFRRIGTGTFNRSGTVSAPSTPRTTPRVEDYLKSAYKTGEKGNPHPVLLRSPGSATYFTGDSRFNKPLLSPRFAEGKFLSRTSSSDLSSRKQGASLISPFRFARGCFSFDNTISDDGHPVGEQPTARPKLPDSLSSSVGMQLEPKTKDLQKLMSSKSWDVGNTPLSSDVLESEQNLDYGSAFRAIPGGGRVLHAKTDYYSVQNNVKVGHNFSPAISTTKSSMTLRTPQRVEIEREDALDILSCLVERSIAFEKEGLTIDSQTREDQKEERDDEEGDVDVSMSPSDHEGETVCIPISEDDKVSTFAEPGVGGETLRSPPKRRHLSGRRTFLPESNSISTKMLDAVNDLREMSEFKDSGEGHKHRMLILDELLCSQVYAVEMKRAAHSASTWLRSIGRAAGIQRDQSTSITLPLGDSLEKNGHEMSERFDVEKAALTGVLNGTDSFEEKMDLLSARAMFRSASLLAKIKTEEAERLNEELTKCRAEIGRLKSAANTDVSFISQSRSILDNEEQSEESEIGIDVEKFEHARKGYKSRQTTDGIVLEVQGAFNGLGIASRSSFSDGEAPLAAEITKSQQTACETMINLRVPEISMKYGHREGNTERASVSRGETIDSKLIDVQNCTSNWEAEPPLPPPPNHDLRCPIVCDLLNQWTSDPSIHHSLLSWVENIIQGANVHTVPPLMISSLDKEVRDGLLAHVLPMVLRRSDISLEVKTRTRRKVTFDIAAHAYPKASPRSPQLPVLDSRSSETPKATNTQALVSGSSFRGAVVPDSILAGKDKRFGQSLDARDCVDEPDSDIGTTSVSHSAVTTHVTNSFARLRDVETTVSEFDGGIPPSESTWNHRNDQPGLMTAFNNTFSGLLSRTKKAPYQQEILHTDDTPGQCTGPPHSWNHSNSVEKEIGDDEPQPYQRVLSCPPGRIGVTFVQYRGHAMVSDVSSESPLSGWVFQSDILIAIDEVPVSGMRVRDIVRLLTARKDRQRALRVISSHAMNEFTLNTSAFSEAGL